MMEEKILLSSVLRKFDLIPINVDDDKHLLAELVLRPKNGLNVTIKTRQK